MPFIRRHWYDIGAIIAVGAVVWLVLGWQGLGVFTRLLLLHSIATLPNQKEKYGGQEAHPAIMTMVLHPSDLPDPSPLNQNPALLVKIGRAPSNSRPPS